MIKLPPEYKKCVESARNLRSVCHFYIGNYETVITYDEENQLNLCVVISLMKLGKCQEAYDKLCRSQWGEQVQTLVLIVLSAKILGIAYQDPLQKLFEKCEMSTGMALLQSVLEINPPEYVKAILDLLIEESGRDKKYIIFRNSYLFTQSILGKFGQ